MVLVDMAPPPLMARLKILALAAAEADVVIAEMVAFSMASMVIPPEVEFTADEFT